jgi:hypothetical protein
LGTSKGRISLLTFADQRGGDSPKPDIDLSALDMDLKRFLGYVEFMPEDGLTKEQVRISRSVAEAVPASG